MIEGACRIKGMDFEQVTRELEIIGQNGIKDNNYNQWSLDFLIDYMVHNHRQFSRDKMPETGKYAKNVGRTW